MDNLTSLHRRVSERHTYRADGTGCSCPMKNGWPSNVMFFIKIESACQAVGEEIRKSAAYMHWARWARSEQHCYSPDSRRRYISVSV